MSRPLAAPLHLPARMLLFRSLTVGLLAASLFLGVQAGSHEHPRAEPAIVAVAVPPASPVTVIDVAHGVPATAIASLVQLAPGERITAVDDHAITSDLAAGALLATRARSGRFIDLTIASATTTRRALVLLH